MTDVQIREIDVHDEQALRAWWEVGHASSVERPFDAWPPWAVLRTALPLPRNDARVTLFTASRDGRVVGAAMLFLVLLDNTHLAQIEIYVRPECRRSGTGRLLLAEVERHSREADRTTVLASTHAPVDAESPGSLFAAAMAYPVASAEEIKLVDLASALPTWDVFDEEVGSRLEGYKLAVFESRVPDEYVDDYCALLSAFITSIPLGDLDLEDARWTPERLREGEERALAAGRIQVMAVAIAPDGHLCGFSDLRVNTSSPDHAGVGGTLVLPGHRGHRLGLGMKLLTHRRALERFPTCAYVETGNAGVNSWMNAVNDQLGYRVVERCLDVQKVL